MMYLQNTYTFNKDFYAVTLFLVTHYAVTLFTNTHCCHLTLKKQRLVASCAHKLNLQNERPDGWPHNNVLEEYCIRTIATTCQFSLCS